MATADLETWKNERKGRLVIRKFDRLTGRTRDEIIGGGRTFHISPEERRLNEDMFAKAEYNFFRNGSLTPVRLLDSEEDAKELASNPQVMTASEMEELFKAHWKTFDKRLAEISNLNTLERLLAVAGEVDATVKQVAQIEARIVELRPEPIAPVEAVDEGPRTTGDGIKAVTPR